MRIRVAKAVDQLKTMATSADSEWAAILGSLDEISFMAETAVESIKTALAVRDIVQQTELQIRDILLSDKIDTVTNAHHAISSLVTSVSDELSFLPESETSLKLEETISGISADIETVAEIKIRILSAGQEITKLLDHGSNTENDIASLPQRIQILEEELTDRANTMNEEIKITATESYKKASKSQIVLKIMGIITVILAIALGAFASQIVARGIKKMVVALQVAATWDLTRRVRENACIKEIHIPRI